MRFGMKISPYGKTIKEATQCTDEETFDLEDIIRCTFPTLDGLTREELIDMAQQADKIYRADLKEKV